MKFSDMTSSLSEVKSLGAVGCPAEIVKIQIKGAKESAALIKFDIGNNRIARDSVDLESSDLSFAKQSQERVLALIDALGIADNIPADADILPYLKENCLGMKINLKFKVNFSGLTVSAYEPLDYDAV